jgi:outer membrane protein TolC
MILAQNDLIDAERGPKLNLFAQAGVGYPNPLNFLDSDPAPYGVVGAGFSWKLTDWNKRNLQRQQISLQAQRLQNAEESFSFNLDQQTASYLAEIERLEAQIKNEAEIAVLQADILTQMAAQLDGGVITATDYLIQLNEELMARQQIVIHQLQLQQLQLNFWNARGGF